MGPLIHGGAQERARRAGTHNTPGIVGLGAAAARAAAQMEETIEKETKLRDYLIQKVLAEIPYSRLNGHSSKRLPNNANFCFRFIEGESLLILLDQKGICASSGSACTSGSLDPSHVLLAIGLPHEIAHGSLRLTLSEETTREDIDVTVEAIKSIVERLRSAGLQFESEAAELASDVLAGRSFVISGKFASHSREEMKALVESHGGRNLAAVSANVDYLVAGEKMGPAKLQKAQKLGVAIISEEEFMEMIGGADSPAPHLSHELVPQQDETETPQQGTLF